MRNSFFMVANTKLWSSIGAWSLGQSPPPFTAIRLWFRPSPVSSVAASIICSASAWLWAEPQNLTISPASWLSLTRLAIVSASGMPLMSCLDAIILQPFFVAAAFSFFLSASSIDSSRSIHDTLDLIAFERISIRSDSIPGKNPPSDTGLTAVSYTHLTLPTILLV